MRKQKKKVTTMRMASRFLFDECRKDGSLRPMKFLFGKYRYGSRNQLKGNLIQYAGYCKRTRQKMCVN